jgi:hypothetical protein
LLLGAEEEVVADEAVTGIDEINEPTAVGGNPGAVDLEHGREEKGVEDEQTAVAKETGEEDGMVLGAADGVNGVVGVGDAQNVDSVDGNGFTVAGKLIRPVDTREFATLLVEDEEAGF